MNIKLHYDDAGWTTFIKHLSNAVKGSETILKKAFMIVWPRDAADHFSQEMGPDGPWAAWAPSTQRARMGHEAKVLKGSKKARDARGEAYARGDIIRAGGKLLQVTGRLRTQTVLNATIQELPYGLKVISETPYSGFLDEGTGKMPARPFMWLSDPAQDRLADVFINGLWNESGGDD